MSILLNAVGLFVTIALVQNIMLKSNSITKHALGSITSLSAIVLAIIIVIIILVDKPGAMV